MNNKYFENINTLEELRKQYKELLKLHHPDNGGNLEIMQEINTEYDRLFKVFYYISRAVFAHLCPERPRTPIPSEKSINHRRCV